MIGLLIVVAVAVVVVGNAGVLRPRLGLVSGVSSTEAGGATKPELTFAVRNLDRILREDLRQVTREGLRRRSRRH